MASNEQTATLLRRNKRALVEALNSVGFNLTEEARAADFAMYVKWAAGLLDINVAANRKRDNKKFFFTVDEWQSLSATEQSMFLLRGVRVRAYSTSFIIAPDTIAGKVWGDSNVTLPGLHNITMTSKDVYSYLDAYKETKLISEGLKNANSEVAGLAAADAALEFKVYTQEQDGIEDTSLWSLPTMAHASLMALYKNKIDEVFSEVWGPDFIIMNGTHWTCTNYYSDRKHSYVCQFQTYGQLSPSPVTNQYAVRPICES